MDEKATLLLEYNLQFFAPADGPGGERTEPATAKKLNDERKKGHVAKSHELNNAVSLVAMFITLKVAVSFLGGRFIGVISWILKLIPDVVATNRSGFTIGAYLNVFYNAVIQLLIMCLPFFAVAMVTGVVITLWQVKWVISTESMKPSLGKFNPVNGFKRLFSARKLFDLGLAIIKILLIFYVAYICLRSHKNELFILYEIPLNQAIALIGDIILDTAIRISLVYIIIGLADYIFQRYKFREDMKMTKQEVKDEYKNSEGDPQIKGKQRRRMMEASQRRMMQSVPEADVVITNPTHLAVALSYKEGEMSAPVLVAKGEEIIAARIKDLAKENKIPIIENKPLARSLYATVDVGEAIPPELYEAVAEILAEIWRNR